MVKHKWYVGVECFKRGLYWQGVVHDWTKFKPVEWFPYVEHFYGNGNNDLEYDKAWLHHQKQNKHHWQWWVLHRDYGDIKALPIPDRYRKEMLSDWIGAGKAISGVDDTWKWYDKARHNMVLHAETREWIEQQLNSLYGYTPKEETTK